MQLTGKQRRYLRSLGHHLEPVVRIGKGGITDGLVQALNQALNDHELVKVRLCEEAPVDRGEAADVLADKCQAAVAQKLGRTILLYRAHPDNPEIVLPGKRAQSVKAPVRLA